MKTFWIKGDEVIKIGKLAEIKVKAKSSRQALIFIEADRSVSITRAELLEAERSKKKHD